MLDDTIAQLSSADPAVRRAAIIALGQSKDPAALRPLATVYRTDPDPSLRELALKAGRYIRQHTAAPPPALEPPPAEAATPDADDRAVPERDRERARSYLDAALSYHTAGQRGRAIDTLGKALSLDPSLAKEPFVRNLMLTLTGRPSNEALAVLTDDQRRDALIAGIGGKEKLAPVRSAEDDATWPAVLLDLALYGLVTVLSTLAMFIFAMPMLERLLEEAIALNPPGGTFTLTDLELFADASLALLLPTALASGVYAVVGVLLQGAAVHFASTTFLGGDGFLVNLYRRMVPFQTAVALLWALSFVAFSLVGSIDTLLAYSLLMSPASLIVTLWLARLIGKVYHFGMGTGCLAIILSGVVLAAFFGCGGLLLGSILGSLL